MRRRLKSAAFPLHRHSLPQLVVDGVLVALAYFLAYRLRFGDLAGGVPERYQHLLEATVGPLVAMSLVVFTLFGFYQRQWRYVGQRDFVKIGEGVLVATLLLGAYIALVKPVSQTSGVGDVGVTAPAGVIVGFFLITLVLLGGVRFIFRAMHERTLRGFRTRKDARGVLIVGAGDGGRLVLREIQRNPGLGLRPVGFVDDDPLKDRLRIDGVQVLGATDALPRILDEAEPDEVTMAIPSASGTVRARVVRACRDRGIPVRTLPTVFELLQNEGRYVRQVRDVQVEDVLGREPVRMELDRVGSYLTNEIVLVTGAGGSIGAELCRQISRVGPRRLICLDHAEDNLFAIQRELLEDRHVHPTALAAVLADCKEEERMREVFAEHRPTIVFHAAAYKHVGLMEANPVEAVRNNAIATRVVARVAGDRGTRAFVLVSTDKAVAPATVMGASKALAEWAVAAEDVRFPATKYVSVRFGNVLGSSGIRRPDLPPPDRARRPGDRDRRPDDALLHDDPGGRPAHHPGRLARRRRRGVRARHGRAGEHPRPRHGDDRALGTRAGQGHRDRGHRAATGREAARAALQPRRAPPADPRRAHPARRAPAALPDLRGRGLRRDRAPRAGGRRSRAGGEGRRARPGPSRRPAGCRAQRRRDDHLAWPPP